jgi:hypothetical protein
MVVVSNSSRILFVQKNKMGNETSSQKRFSRRRNSFRDAKYSNKAEDYLPSPPRVQIPGDVTSLAVPVPDVSSTTTIIPRSSSNISSLSHQVVRSLDSQAISAVDVKTLYNKTAVVTWLHSWGESYKKQVIDLFSSKFSYILFDDEALKNKESISDYISFYKNYRRYDIVSNLADDQNKCEEMLSKPWTRLELVAGLTKGSLLIINNLGISESYAYDFLLLMRRYGLMTDEGIRFAITNSSKRLSTTPLSALVPNLESLYPTWFSWTLTYLLDDLDIKTKRLQVFYLIIMHSNVFPMEDLEADEALPDSSNITKKDVWHVFLRSLLVLVKREQQVVIPLFRINFSEWDSAISSMFNVSRVLNGFEIAEVNLKYDRTMSGDLRLMLKA